MSAYIAFCTANRDAFKASNPRAELGDMGRLLRAHWNGLSEREKAIYAEPGIKISFTNEREQDLRRSSRLRNKRLGLDFWGIKR